MSEMTEYQKAVAEHMATAPDDLKKYVCERLKESSDWKDELGEGVVWKEGTNPIYRCGFNWGRSEEGDYFWYCIDQREWEDAINTEFWERYTEQRQQHQKPKAEAYDFINPPHYQKFSVEVIDMMAAIWGKEATAIHCEMCAFKYRLRMGEKPDQPVERDLEKVNWYLNKAKELRS